MRPHQGASPAGRRRQALDAPPFLFDAAQPRGEHVPAQSARGACQHGHQNEHGVSDRVPGVHPGFYASAMTE
jgi:hypothetical protein